VVTALKKAQPRAPLIERPFPRNPPSPAGKGSFPAGPPSLGGAVGPFRGPKNWGKGRAGGIPAPFSERGTQLEASVGASHEPGRLRESGLVSNRRPRAARAPSSESGSRLQCPERHAPQPPELPWPCRAEDLVEPLDRGGGSCLAQRVNTPGNTSMRIIHGVGAASTKVAWLGSTPSPGRRTPARLRAADHPAEFASTGKDSRRSGLIAAVSRV